MSCNQATAGIEIVASSSTLSDQFLIVSLDFSSLRPTSINLQRSSTFPKFSRRCCEKPTSIRGGLDVGYPLVTGHKNRSNYRQHRIIIAQLQGTSPCSLSDVHLHDW